MHTKNHFKIGLLFSQLYILHDFDRSFDLPQAGIELGACAVGAVAPDLVMIPRYLYDKYVLKIQPMTKQGALLMTIKQISHSIFVCLILTIFAAMFAVFYPGSIGLALNAFAFSALFAGVIPDIFTHTGKEYIDTDPTFIWPFRNILGYDRIRFSENAIEDYRYEHGLLVPKPMEEEISRLVVKLFLGTVIFNCLLGLIVFM